jgi:SAM-dependent methyltransferase
MLFDVELIREKQPDAVFQELKSLEHWQELYNQRNAGDMLHRVRAAEWARERGITSVHFGQIPTTDISIYSPTDDLVEIIANGLSTRERAVLDMIAAMPLARKPDDARICAGEALSTFAKAMRGRYARFIGSQYTPGREEWLFPIHHQDLMRLSYPNSAFDVFVTIEVLEHLPHLETALSEMYRVLRPGGMIIATFPFLYFSKSTQLKAKLIDGEIQLLDDNPEYHGDPMQEEGVLVYQLPGWDFIALATSVGFSNAAFVYYGSTVGGIVGSHVDGHFIFTARKPCS